MSQQLKSTLMKLILFWDVNSKRFIQRAVGVQLDITHAKDMDILNRRNALLEV